MKIGLIGYGKMGKEIERLAQARGHQITAIIDFDNRDSLNQWSTATVDVAIEFTAPELAYDNIRTCIEHGIPVVSGTTGWLEKKEALDNYCQQQRGAYFYASNFSLGVNITFKVNEFLARIMNKIEGFSVSMEEIHHSEKKDAPSGTAITLAEGILNNTDNLHGWALENSRDSHEIPIHSVREGKVPGTHTVWYRSDHDAITLSHEALNRTGFALGAVLVAEWMPGKKGVLSMDDFLEL